MQYPVASSTVVAAPSWAILYGTCKLWYHLVTEGGITCGTKIINVVASCLLVVCRLRR